MMLGQGSENSAGEKESTRETERLSRNELTFTDLTKKRGTLTYLRLHNLPLPSTFSLPLTTPRRAISSPKHKHARGHCIGA